MGVIWVKAIFIILLPIIGNQATEAHKILLVNANFKSHMILFCQLGKALAEKGHDVTILKMASFILPLELNDPRITIETYSGPELIYENSPDVQDAIVEQMKNNFSIASAINFMRTAVSVCENDAWSLFDDQELLKRLDDAKFDFAVVATPLIKVYTYLVYKLGIPFAYMHVECFMTQMSLPSISPNYIPNVYLAGLFGHEPTLFLKTINTIAYLSYVLSLGTSPGADRVHEIVPERPPVSFAHIERNATICLRVRESIMDIPRPNLPNVIDVGSMLIRDVQELPVHIQHFLDTAPDGVIFVSFGSVADTLPDDLFARMIQAFKKTKYRIIWKWRKMQDLQVPEDQFLVLPWAPQVDILAHENTRCFVSHCGYGSALEAVYHGVPIVGLPLFADQQGNALMMEHKGFAKVLDASSFESDALVNALEYAVNGPLSLAIQKASAIFKDMPSGKDKAVFWIEHVIKHGADHLRSPAITMPLWEYLMLDVAGVVLVMVVMVSCACRYCWRRACKSRRGKATTKGIKVD